MSIGEFKRYHGAALTSLIDGCRDAIALRRVWPENNALYELNNQAALYLKYSSARLSPWVFSFGVEHLLDLVKAEIEYRDVFLVLICGFECLAVLDAKDRNSVIDLQATQAQRIRVATGTNRKMTVTGTVGKTRNKLARTESFQKVYAQIGLTPA